MGCIQSSSKISSLEEKKENDGIERSYTQIINQRSSHARMEIIERVKTLCIKSEENTITLNYAYLSQRGYYPHALGKANQDSYVICESILGDQNCHLFGIFDGHGEYGDYCSHFAAEKMPHYLQKLLHDKGGTQALNTNEMEKIFVESFELANSALHKSHVDDHLSGTTGITVCVKGETLFVSNVGDSRAIIASLDDGGALKYSPLSSDQTPYRADERARLKECGAKIMTIDQIEGRELIHENWGAETGDTIDETGDPPRVWDKSLERPGCAFTRSLGDAYAETIGVNAVPEVLKWELTQFDKYIIIASDGVFEFLTSQNVVNIIAQYPDIIEGARRVVEESYRLWLTYDERTDDISLIIISIEDFRANQNRRDSNNKPSTRIDALSTRSGGGFSARSVRNRESPQDSKPVRRFISKVQRKEIAANWVSNEEDLTFDFKKNAVKKNPEELARIANMLKSNFLFQHLSHVQRDQMYQVMILKYIYKGQLVIKEGEIGDEMYIVDSGEFLCTKKDADGVAQSVFTYSNPGSSFGELSLMYGKPRAASVRAVTDGRLWVINRKAYRSILVKIKQNDLLQAIQAIPIISDLPFTQQQRLCESTVEKNYNDGEVIYNGETATASKDKQSYSEVIAQIETIPNSPVPQNNPPPFLLPLNTQESFNRFPLASPQINESSLDWVLCVVLAGQVKLIGKDGNNNRIRSTRSYLLSAELGKYYSGFSADGRTKLAFISTASFVEIAGEKPKKQLIDNMLARCAFLPMSPVSVMPKTTRNKNLNGKSEFKAPTVLETFPDNSSCEGMPQKGDYSVENVIAMVGEYAYIGTFSSTFNSMTKSKISGKIIAKKRAAISNIDSRLLQEKEILSSMKLESKCIPLITSVLKDERSILVLFSEVYTCDLAFASGQCNLKIESKIFYLACVYSAIRALHNCGIVHRYINSGSIFISQSGIAKVMDMRFAKKMNGSKSFTICGDPIYFAPEIISAQGYNYAVDLWALGIVAYDLFEGVLPIGNADMEETAIYTAITNVKPGSIQFSPKIETPKDIQDFITLLLHPFVPHRLGYRSSAEITTASIFKDIAWDSLGNPSCVGHPINTLVALDTSSLFAESDLEEYNSVIFDQF